MPARRDARPTIRALALLATLALALAACGGTPGAMPERGSPTAPATPTIGRPTPTATARATTVPTLTLEPDRGLCNERLIIRGSGFPPGKRVQVGGRPIVPFYQDVVHLLPERVVAPDGTFVVETIPAAFECRPEALQVSIWAGVQPRDGITPDVNARYTVSATPPPYPAGPYLATPAPPAPATSATPVRGTPAPPASPPAGILVYGDETQVGALGNYCWRAGWQATGSCAERGLPFPPATLAVPRGATLRFAAPGVPTMLLDSAAIYPLPARPATGAGPTLILLAADPSGQTVTIPDTLPPGDYALIVRAGPGWGGEVTYGFHLTVR